MRSRGRRVAPKIDHTLSVYGFEKNPDFESYSGYPMSIKDIAAAFYVIDPTKKGDGDNEVATIDCNNKYGAPAKDRLIGGDNFLLCNHPTFAIKRYVFHKVLAHVSTEQNN